MLRYKAALTPLSYIPNYLLRYYLESHKPILFGQSKIYSITHSEFAALTGDREEATKVTEDFPVGIYLGEILKVTTTNCFRAKLLSLDGQIIWF